MLRKKFSVRTTWFRTLSIMKKSSHAEAGSDRFHTNESNNEKEIRREMLKKIREDVEIG